jgi:mannose-6-phosphate isomerase-like protein (cupin superfamily)
MSNIEHFKTMHVPSEMDERAPDGSEIRFLVRMKEASFVHCTLPPQHTSFSGMIKNLEEVWYCIQGRGQIWRKWQDDEEIVDVYPGTCLTIPAQTHFQFRSTSWEPLCFIIATMPPWPGEQEWIMVSDHWQIEKQGLDT